MTFGCGQQAPPALGPRTRQPARARRRQNQPPAPAGRRPRSPAGDPGRAHRRQARRGHHRDPAQPAASLFWGVPNGWSNLSKIDALTGDWLVMPDADGTLVPRLAREVPTLANGGARFDGEGAARRLRVTYRLRDGPGLAGWHAADLRRRRVRLRAPADAGIPADRPFAGRARSTGSWTPNPLTAEFVFKPGAFDPDFARVGEPYPKHLWSGIAPAQLLKSEHATKPVHAGPYRLKESRPNEYVMFEANPRYWAGPPRTPTIVMKVAADSNAMLAQAKAGQQEITMFGYTGADLLPELERYAADGRHTGDRAAEHQHADRRAESRPPDPTRRPRPSGAAGGAGPQGHERRDPARPGRRAQ